MKPHEQIRLRNEYRDEAKRWRRIALILAGVLAGIVIITTYQLAFT